MGGTRAGGAAAKRGPPAIREPGQTKQRILRIAADEFAKRGYDGARVDEIVRRGKVSKNLVYHYFHSKDELFAAVLEGAYASLRKRQQAMGLESSEPIEGIVKLVTDTFNHWNESRHFIAYLNSENFYNAKHIKKSKFIRTAYPGLVEAIRDLLNRGEKQGLFRSGIDPVDLYISISALTYHFFSNQRTFSVIFRRNFNGPDKLRQRLEHVLDLVIGYLRYKPGN